MIHVKQLKLMVMKANIKISEIKLARTQCLSGGMPGWVNFKKIVNSVENDILRENGCYPENINKEIQEKINNDDYAGKQIVIDWR